MTPTSTSKSIYDISVKDLSGKEVKMEKFKGKCLLIVNVASDCKLMKENLEQLRGIKEKFFDGRAWIELFAEWVQLNYFQT